MIAHGRPYAFGVNDAAPEMKLRVRDSVMIERSAQHAEIEGCIVRYHQWLSKKRAYLFPQLVEGALACNLLCSYSMHQRVPEFESQLGRPHQPAVLFNHLHVLYYRNAYGACAVPLFVGGFEIYCEEFQLVANFNCADHTSSCLQASFARVTLIVLC